MASPNNTTVTSHDRKLKYRNMLADLSTVEDIVDNDERMNRTASAIRETKQLLAGGSVEECARHPGEVYLDSRVLREASNLAVRCSEAFSGNVNVYDKNELAVHIRENADYWSFMFPGEVPAMGYLFGTFAPTPPEQRPRAPRRQVHRQQAKTLKAPTNVDRLEKVEKSAQMVKKVNQYIRNMYDRTKQPLSYFHTVLDPNSFSSTIENIYYVSFLVQDTKISVQLDDEFGLPFITPVSAAEQEQSEITEQLIISMDKQKWMELIDAFDITEPMMKISR